MIFKIPIWGNMPKYVFLVFALIVLAGCTTEEAKKDNSWKQYSQSEDYQFFYDEKSIVPQHGGIIRLSLKRKPKEEYPVINETKKGIIREMKKRQKAGMSIKGYENWDHEAVICEIDCKASLIRYRSSINYDVRGGVLDAISVPVSLLKWEKIIPSTINDNLRRSVCASP